MREKNNFHIFYKLTHLLIFCTPQPTITNAFATADHDHLVVLAAFWVDLLTVGCRNRKSKTFILDLARTCRYFSKKSAGNMFRHLFL